MKRIRKFTLGSHDIKVKYVKELYDEGDNEIFGRASARANIIEIATTIGGKPLAEDVIIHTIHHELAHMVLILMNEWDLNSNEKFVDGLGGYIAQFNKTKR